MIDKKMAAQEPPPRMSMSYKEKEYYKYCCGVCGTEWDMEIFRDNLYCPVCGKKDKPYSIGDARGIVCNGI